VDGYLYLELLVGFHLMEIDVEILVGDRIALDLLKNG